MRYFLYFFSLACLVFSATWAYRVNYETREVVKRIKVLQKEITKEEEKLIMLEGEWAYLNRPDRLNELAERFFPKLSLMPISSDNYAQIDTVSFKDPIVPDASPIDTALSLSNVLEVTEK